MRRTPLVLTTMSVVLTAGLVLSGCGSSSTQAQPGVQPSVSGSASADPAALAQVRAYCDGLASGTQVAAVAGTPVGTVSVQSLGSTPGCRWDAADGSAVHVELVNASSSTWAAQLPQIAASLASSGVVLGPALQRGLRQAAAYVSRGQEVDADLACTIFTQLAVASGSAAGAEVTVRVVPSATAPQVITVQACSGDEYSFAQLTSPDLAGDLQTRISGVEHLLQQVHGAPLHFSPGTG